MLACQRAETSGLRVVKKFPHSHILDRSIEPQHKAITANWNKANFASESATVGSGEEEIQVIKYSKGMAWGYPEGCFCVLVLQIANANRAGEHCCGY